MANASSAGPRLLSGEAPQADDISRADTELTSLEEGRRPLSLDEPLRISSLRSTSMAEPTADQSGACGFLPGTSTAATAPGERGEGAQEKPGGRGPQAAATASRRSGPEPSDCRGRGAAGTEPEAVLEGREA